MDRANKLSPPSSSPPSSLAVDLFGPKDSSSKSSNSSTGFFGSIFGPQTSMAPGTPQDYVNGQHETTSDYKSEKSNPNPMKNEVNSSYENGRCVDPCHFNSSIYYGAQDSYSPSNRNTLPQNLKKDGANADQTESNSSGASRGNWWQGSLYY